MRHHFSRQHYRCILRRGFGSEPGGDRIIIAFGIRSLSHPADWKQLKVLENQIKRSGRFIAVFAFCLLETDSLGDLAGTEPNQIHKRPSKSPGL